MNWRYVVVMTICGLIGLFWQFARDFALFDDNFSHGAFDVLFVDPKDSSEAYKTAHVRYAWLYNICAFFVWMFVRHWNAGSAFVLGALIGAAGLWAVEKVRKMRNGRKAEQKAES